METIPDLTFIPTIIALFHNEPREVYIGRNGLLMIRNNKGGVMRYSGAVARLQTTDGKRLTPKKAIALATEVAPHTRQFGGNKANAKPDAPSATEAPHTTPRAPAAPAAPAPRARRARPAIKYLPPLGDPVGTEFMILHDVPHPICEYEGQRYIGVGLPYDDALAVIDGDEDFDPYNVNYIPPNGEQVDDQTLLFNEFTYPVYEYNDELYIGVGVSIDDALALGAKMVPKPQRRGKKTPAPAPAPKLHQEPTLVRGINVLIGEKYLHVYRGEKRFLYLTEDEKFRPVPRDSLFFRSFKPIPAPEF